jgi:hypothetical protein
LRYILINQNGIELTHFKTFATTGTEIVNNIMYLSGGSDDRFFRTFGKAEVAPVTGHSINGKGPHIQANSGPAGAVKNMLFQLFPE